MELASLHGVVDATAPLPLSSAVQSLRVGVVGARCQRQGVGKHVVRHLADLGAEVCAIAGTSRETVEQAREQLKSRYRVAPRGYVDVRELLQSEELDALCICSPDRFHLEHLEAALEARVHVLCEKPLLFDRGRDFTADAARLIQGFAKAGKLLAVNEQWPYTLPCFDRLYPQANIFERPPEQLQMLLCPGHAHGSEMLPNSLPHALSLLLTLCPAGGRAVRTNVAVHEEHQGLATALTLDFDYLHARGTTAVSLDLCQVPEQPRPAGYAINGLAVRRVVEMPGYVLHFTATDEPWQMGRFRLPRGERPPRKLRIDDPLGLLLADFLTRVTQARLGTKPADDGTLLSRMQLLRTVDAAARLFLKP